MLPLWAVEGGAHPLEVITSPAGGVGAARCKLPDTAALGGLGVAVLLS